MPILWPILRDLTDVGIRETAQEVKWHRERSADQRLSANAVEDTAGLHGRPIPHCRLPSVGPDCMVGIAQSTRGRQLRSDGSESNDHTFLVGHAAAQLQSI